MNIGFIGLGNMGAPMCRNLIEAGHQAKVFDLDDARVRGLVDAGARGCGAVAEVAAGGDVVFLSLPNQHSVREVALGHAGLLGAMPAGSVLVDLSTSLPSVTRELGSAGAARGVDVLDAPVSGGIEGAQAGNLSVLIGGAAAVVAKVLPLLHVIGEPGKCFHVGALGAGHTMKLIHSHLNAITLVGIAEALVVGRKAGVDPQMMFDIISVSRGNSGIFQSRAPRMLDGAFDAAFTLDLTYKDLSLAAVLAEEMKIPVGVGQAARTVYEVARAMGRGGDDMAAVVTVLEEWAGVNVRRAAASGR